MCIRSVFVPTNYTCQELTGNNTLSAIEFVKSILEEAQALIKTDGG